MHAINKNLKHAVMVVPIQGVDEFVFEVNKGLCLKKHMEILAWKATFSKLRTAEESRQNSSLHFVLAGGHKNSTNFFGKLHAFRSPGQIKSVCYGRKLTLRSRKPFQSEPRNLNFH